MICCCCFPFPQRRCHHHALSARTRTSSRGGGGRRGEGGGGGGGGGGEPLPLGVCHVEHVIDHVLQGRDDLKLLAAEATDDEIEFRPHVDQSSPQLLNLHDLSLNKVDCWLHSPLVLRGHFEDAH